MVKTGANTIGMEANVPSDNPIIACAVEGEADFFWIVNPDTFLQIIGR